MHGYSVPPNRRPLSRAQTSIGSMQMMSMDGGNQSQQHQWQMGHRHSISMHSQPHLPQQPSNLSLQTSVSQDLADLDDSGIGMGLVDDDSLSKFSFTTADIGAQLMGHGDLGVNMV